MNRRSLLISSVLSLVGLAPCAAAKPLKPKPDKYNRGLWAQVFYKDCGAEYIADYDIAYTHSKRGKIAYTLRMLERDMSIRNIIVFDGNRVVLDVGRNIPLPAARGDLITVAAYSTPTVNVDK